MAEAGPGKIRLFNDFAGVGNLIAETVPTAQVGDFYAGGEGFADGDAGISGANVLSGAVTLTSANTDADMTFIGTHVIFDVGLMGTLVAEARVNLADLDTKVVYFGFTSALTTDEQMDDIADANTITMTLTATSMAGFILADTLTSDEEWHVIYNGGTTTGETDSRELVTGVDAVAGEFDILRVEIDTNGTVRWFVNGDLKKTVVGAVSTTTNLAALIGAGANTTEFCIFDVDYLLVSAARDWTR